MCLTALVGLGTTTAFAAGEQAEVYLISFPRSGDANLDYGGSWGHPNLQYMNGWYSGNSKYTTIRAMHSYEGNICYCIEPGVRQDTGDTYTSKDETFWDNLPSDINSTISPYDMKLFIGRIMQYGYTGPISTSWRSQNPADAATLAEAMATQVLIWETVVGERDEDFDYVSPGSYDAVKGVISTAHPLYDLFCDYYDSIEASVQRHSAIPSFMSKNPNRAQSVELEWDGSGYTATLTDHNRVLSDYNFSANEDGISFSVSGNQLVITATDAPSDSVRITANKVGSSRRGVITWTDGTFNQGSGKQDVITYAQSVSDPVQAFLNLKVSYGSAKIIKTSEDGKVDNLTFTVTGNGINQTVKTNSKGEIQIDNLMPGVYTVTEMDYDKYEPQESRRVTVVSGQVSTVTFNNKLKRGDLQIVKSSEDNLNEGVTFHLYGTSLSGIAVDEYAVTDANGVATFEDVLISGSTPYTVEEVDTAVRYVVPEAQSAPINWNEVTNRSFLNILKKFSVTVTKSDAETGTAQGDASLAGAVYGIYKGETLVDSYATDKNGQFTSKEYICDSDWTVREITPSEGYLLDNTVHKVGIEPQLYTVDSNSISNQKEILLAYAQRNNFPNPQFFTDDGFSGTTFDRPSFIQMENLVEQGLVDTIIVKDLSRFGRNYLDVGNYLEIKYPTLGIRFIAIQENVDTLKETGTEMMPFNNIFNEWYAAQTSKKIRAVWKNKAANGKRVSSSVPFGYLKNPQDKEDWLVDEPAADIVRKIYALCLDGRGPLQIAKQLEQEKVLIPSAYYASLGRKTRKQYTHPYAWDQKTVAGILANQQYTGCTVNFMTTTVSYKVHKTVYNPKDEWQIIPNTQPAIIDEDTWKRVQELRENRIRPTATGRTSLFSGKVFCADCGSKLHFCAAKSLNANQEHYRCANYKSGRGNCQIHYIRNVVLEKIVLEAINSLADFVRCYEPVFLYLMAQKDIVSKRTETNRLKSSIESGKRRIQDLDKLIERIYEDQVLGNNSAERYARMSINYENEQRELVKRVDEDEKRLVSIEQTSLDLKILLKVLRNSTAFEELTPTLVNSLIRRIEVHNNDKSSGHCSVKVDIYFTAIGLIDIPTEDEIKSLMEKIQANPQEYRLTA